MAVLVSVYCTAYNHEKYIRDALEGFVNQKTNFEYEVFVHDDASVDNTASIIMEYAEKYPHIIKPIIQKENQYSQGVQIFQKYIFPLMKGRYIAICEGDDYWCDTNKLQKQVDFLESHAKYVACVHNYWILDAHTNEKKVCSRRSFNHSIKMVKIIEWNKVGFQTASVMYRREIDDNPPLYLHAINGVGDLPNALWMRLNGKVFYMKKPMSVYRTNVEGSWSTRNHYTDKNRMELLQIYEDFNKESSGRYSYWTKKEVDRQIIEISYNNLDFPTLYTMGYRRIVLRGYVGVAVSMFLQKHCYKLYRIISNMICRK